jgi:hypothetical protein
MSQSLIRPGVGRPLTTDVDFGGGSGQVIATVAKFRFTAPSGIGSLTTE